MGKRIFERKVEKERILGNIFKIKRTEETRIFRLCGNQHVYNICVLERYA